jgi:dTDP-glucose 4,6-dehydratase
MGAGQMLEFLTIAGKLLRNGGLSWTAATTPMELNRPKMFSADTTGSRMSDMEEAVLVTGGAGFIGSNFVLDWLKHESADIVNLDCLTYAGNLENLSTVFDSDRHQFVEASINDVEATSDLLRENRPRAIVHFAAESHVDRSIHGPETFVETNVVGTFRLLQAAREYWNSLPDSERSSFRFLHVSTDEVYGSLGPDDPLFSETTAYAPNSPYAASKAASDHLVRSYHHTYGLPTLITNCSNNYGPHQFPEKMIPLMIVNALSGKPLPVYGDGLNVRDWLFVSDHCEAIRLVLQRGTPGQTYNIGGWNEKTNLEVIRIITTVLEEMAPKSTGTYESLITFVKDRPGHDRRYAIDASKIERELGWRPKRTFESGIRETVRWYLENMGWVANVTSGAYKEWISKNYSARAGA